MVEALAARRALTALALRQGANAEEAQAWATELAGPVPWSLPALRRRQTQLESTGNCIVAPGGRGRGSI